MEADQNDQLEHDQSVLNNYVNALATAQQNNFSLQAQLNITQRKLDAAQGEIASLKAAAKESPVEDEPIVADEAPPKKTR